MSAWNQIKGGRLPNGFEFLDDRNTSRACLRRQFLKTITHAHTVTAKKKSKEFKAVMAHYIWDNTQPDEHFSAVLTALAKLFVALHHQSKK